MQQSGVFTYLSNFWQNYSENRNDTLAHFKFSAQQITHNNTAQRTPKMGIIFWIRHNDLHLDSLFRIIFISVPLPSLSLLFQKHSCTSNDCCCVTASLWHHKARQRQFFRSRIKEAQVRFYLKTAKRGTQWPKDESLLRKNSRALNID